LTETEKVRCFSVLAAVVADVAVALGVSWSGCGSIGIHQQATLTRNSDPIYIGHLLLPRAWVLLSVLFAPR